MANQPWRHATGPTTPEGKRKSARNGKSRQVGLQSVRGLRASLAQFRAAILGMRACRARLATGEGGAPPPVGGGCLG